MKRKDPQTRPTAGAPEASSGRGGREKTDRQFVNALGRGLKVLRAFKPHDPPLSNLELAKRTGLPRPTISRLTYTLTELGYLTYHEQFGCYELGGGTLALGHVARANFNAGREIRPVMERLAQFSGANVGLGTRERLNMVYVEACQGPSLVGLRLDVGSHVPIISSAMGRAYLAAISEDERTHLTKQLKKERKADEAAVQRELDLAVKDLNAHGFCISTGDWHRDIHGVALSITAPELGGIFVINCGGPAYLLPRNRLVAEIGPELINAVNEIKQALGATHRPKLVLEDHSEPPRLPKKARVRAAGKAGALSGISGRRNDPAR
ncbi:MAG TPA: IclR family transcriptional regulator [Steroidobacteraceae bacterium]|nr:IclR family transcriptional regulator [Steroidobacteraceae bacterium]